MNLVHHTNLADGRRYDLSLAQQMGNIGSEVWRTLKAKQEQSAKFTKAAERMLELFDLTLSDRKYEYAQLKEISRLRECICSYLWGENEYNMDDTFLTKYFTAFGVVANRKQ